MPKLTDIAALVARAEALCRTIALWAWPVSASTPTSTLVLESDFFQSFSAGGQTDC